MKFITDLQKRSSLHHHFRRRCRRRHMDGLLSHVNPTNKSAKATLAFVGVLILLGPCTHTTGHNETKNPRKRIATCFFVVVHLPPCYCSLLHDNHHTQTCILSHSSCMNTHLYHIWFLEVILQLHRITFNMDGGATSLSVGTGSKLPLSNLQP